jgi:hypothetical protein
MAKTKKIQLTDAGKVLNAALKHVHAFDIIGEDGVRIKSCDTLILYPKQGSITRLRNMVNRLCPDDQGYDPKKNQLWFWWD